MCGLRKFIKTNFSAFLCAAAVLWALHPSLHTSRRFPFFRSHSAHTRRSALRFFDVRSTVYAPCAWQYGPNGSRTRASFFFRFGDRFRIACFPFAAETPVKTKPCTVFALRTLSLSALKKSACCGHGFRRPVLPTPSVGGSPVCTPIIPRIFGLSIPFLKIFKIFCERHSVRPFASHTPSYAGAQAKGAAAQNVFAEYASRQRLIAGKSEGVSTKSAFSSGAPFSVTMTAYSSFCRSKAAKTSNTVASPLRKT